MTRRLATLVVLLVILPACAGGEVGAPPARSLAAASLPDEGIEREAPTPGRVRVAVPEEPAAWWNPGRPDVASDDLAALWGLPLLRVDEHGQVRRGLVRDWTVVGAVEGGWAVDLAIGQGTWSDGSEVAAQDVVATIDAAVARDGAAFGAVQAVSTVEPGVVRLQFARPTSTWADLLVEVGSVLPAALVPEAEALYANEVPVSGGPFRLESYEPGLRAVFTAHEGSPLGGPAMAEVEVLFVPGYEAALGLLEDGDVDVVLGHLGLNPVGRAEEIDGVEAAAPLGGTTVSVRFRGEGAYGADDAAGARRGIREVFDVELLVEGLLGEVGAVASTPWPDVPLPVELPGGDLDAEGALVLVLPGSNEMLSFTARALERDLTNLGVAGDLVSSPTPRFPADALGIGDAALVVVRSSARPPLGAYVPDDLRDVVRAGEEAGWPSDAAREALVAVADSAEILPLYRPGVLHAWKGVDGIRPSAWRGAGFWNVADWTLADPA